MPGLGESPSSYSAPVGGFFDCRWCLPRGGPGPKGENPRRSPNPPSPESEWPSKKTTAATALMSPHETGTHTVKRF